MAARDGGAWRQCVMMAAVWREGEGGCVWGVHRPAFDAHHVLRVLHTCMTGWPGITIGSQRSQRLRQNPSGST